MGDAYNPKRNRPSPSVGSGDVIYLLPAARVPGLDPNLRVPSIGLLAGAKFPFRRAHPYFAAER